MSVMSIAATRTPQFPAWLIGRGVVMLSFGAAAVRWPDASLVPALIAAAAVLAVSGAYELWLAVSVAHTSSRWPVLVLDGLACLAFALLTVGFPSVPLGSAMLMIAGWLTLYGAFCGAVAVVLWPLREPRALLAACAVINLALAILAVLYTRPTVTLVLYAGAAYATVFGMGQIATGLWLRRTLRASRLAVA